jgi:hypothetical protein
MATPPAVDQLRAMAQLLPAKPVADHLTVAVATALADGIDAIGRPMHLAVTGQIKRGKSTLVNALTRSEIAQTGLDEVTADFHEFHFVDAAAPTATGAPTRPQSRPLLRRKEPAHIVSTVRAALPSDLRLIDTPGLGSPVNDTHGNAALRADCAVHLFHRNVHQADVAYLRGLLAKEGTQPLPTRVLGVISACDLSWPPGPDHAESKDPLGFHPLRDYAGGIIKQIERNPVNHELFYAVLPIAALVSEGGWALTAAQIEVLADLAKRCDERVLAGHLESQARFVETDLIADRGHRRALVERLGLWGVHLACQYLRDPAGDEAGLRLHLDEESGVARLRAAVVDHFVRRGTFIKLEQHLRRVENVVADGRTRLQLGGGAMPPELVDVSRRLERLRATSLGLSELALVELIHRHEHRLTTAEAAQLAELTGALGTTCMERLGLPVYSGVRDMLHRAFELQRHWNQREMAVPALAPALVRAYERLIGRISEAKSLLDSLD